MILALDKTTGERIEATETGQRAECPCCGAEVLSKCGEHTINHWAHVNSEDCDPWHEPISTFHLWWQYQFPKSWREVTIKGEDGTQHRADILIPGWGVVEVQHSPISSQKIREREEFYRHHTGNICWIVDARDFWERFKNVSWGHNPEHYAGLTGSPRSRFKEHARWDVLANMGYDSPEDAKNLSVIKWKSPRKSWYATRSPVIFDGGKEGDRRRASHAKGEFEYRDTFIWLSDIPEEYDDRYLARMRHQPLYMYEKGEWNFFHKGGPRPPEDYLLSKSKINNLPEGWKFAHEWEGTDCPHGYLMGGEFMHRNRVINGLKARAVYPEIEGAA